MQDKVLSLLGLARRAGKLEAGYDSAVSAARGARARALLAAADVSDKTWKNLCYEAKNAGIPACRLSCGMAETGRACGKKAGVFGVTDAGFAAALLKAAGQAENGSREKEEEAL